jgi:hypothetical protein
VRARRQAAEHRGHRRHAGREGEGRPAALEGRDHRLDLADDRVGVAAVVEAPAVAIVRVAQEGGRGLERRDDPARDLVDGTRRLGEDRGRPGVLG